MRILKAIVLIAATLFIACDGLIPATGDLPPFVITKPVMEITERPYQYFYAGIAFNFLNNSDAYVDRIIVSFMLFDAKTQGSPFTGNNKFEIAKHDMVFPGENKEMFISLDRYIYTAPSEPYVIDFFYVSEIHYTDGGTWEDRQGKYRVRF
jgi:hypothetical protein